MAVTGAADGILGHIHLRAEGAGDTVVGAVAGGCDLHEGTLEPAQFLLIGSHVPDNLRVVEDADQIPGSPNFKGANTEGVGDFVGDF
jgi:hypothetical protein